MSFAEPPQQIAFSLPTWIFTEHDLSMSRPSDEDWLDLAVGLAQSNVEHGGGPFGAVVVETGSGRVIAPGVNLVVPASCSLLHAEIVALMFAQARLQSFTLASGDYTLFTSSEPCIQCLGACHWAGLSRLVCGAPRSEAEAAGFDEGPRSPDWQEQLRARGTEVRTGVRAAAAAQVLSDYARRGLLRYNARSKPVQSRD
jgi:tRNA(Arg) A34 adenosine deaminase TadA